MTRVFESDDPSRWVSHTPSDSTDISGCVGFYVGAAGDVAVRCAGDPATTVTFVGVPTGATIKGNFTRIMAATTATSVLVAYA